MCSFCFSGKKASVRRGGARAWGLLYADGNSRENTPHFDRRALPKPDAYYAQELGVLRGSGVWRQALCPFHKDHSPSFSINVITGGFHCFGCGVKGDLMSFHMRRHGLDFKRAAQALGAWK